MDKQKRKMCKYECECTCLFKVICKFNYGCNLFSIKVYFVFFYVNDVIK